LKLPIGPVRGVVTFSLIAANTLLCGTPLILLALTKLAVPLAGWRRKATVWLTAIAEQWAANNGAILRATQDIRWNIRGNDGLEPRDCYFVVANHQSWADIFALHAALNRRIPFLKFFLKQELIWVPVMGLAWWSLDMPFMKRYSRDYLEKHPEKKGRDLEVTRRACAKYQDMPTSVFNFLEGTRFTPAKHGATGSPYRHLLPPRAGGIAFVLASMGGCMRALIDVTIAYPEGVGGFWDLCSGRISAIAVDVRQLPIEEWLTAGDYSEDPAFRARFQRWISQLWEAKDARLEHLC
jgi:1-acyl-sn-glycerol-3-phosphate acyltransferase